MSAVIMLHCGLLIMEYPVKRGFLWHGLNMNKVLSIAKICVVIPLQYRDSKLLRTCFHSKSCIQSPIKYWSQVVKSSGMLDYINFNKLIGASVLSIKLLAMHGPDNLFWASLIPSDQSLWLWTSHERDAWILALKILSTLIM